MTDDQLRQALRERQTADKLVQVDATTVEMSQKDDPLTTIAERRIAELLADLEAAQARIAELEDEERRAMNATHEVVIGRNERVFSGSRAACWAYRKQHGGYVREKGGEDE